MVIENETMKKLKTLFKKDPNDLGSAEVPAVRVRNYNEETGKIEYGTVIDATLNTYLVIPDYNLQMTVRWDKTNCDVLR